MSATRIGRALRRRGETLAVVETSAGGLLLAALLQVPGASAWLVGGVVPYSASARRALLGVEDLGAAGAVSEEAALRLADAARQRLGADWAVAETGIAGPQTGRQSSKPAGLTCLALVGPAMRRSATVQLPDQGRRANMRGFARAAAQFLAAALEESESVALRRSRSLRLENRNVAGGKRWSG
ncbi:MAG: CinA family protein [Chloroflexota bacterium]|nr:CinA family protein [Dehalococcoidia bacterium]MDW8252732.1 CinA family protein [Chloroflexota bacterium]